MNAILLLSVVLGQPPQAPPVQPYPGTVSQAPAVRKYGEPDWYTADRYSAAFREAERTGKPMVLWFTNSKTCPRCVEFEQTCFSTAIREEISTGYVACKCDTATDAGMKLAAAYNVDSWPKMLVYRGGKFDDGVTGVVGAGAVLNLLQNKKVVTVKPVVPNGYNPTHNCPTCGNYQNVIESRAGSTHTHRCGSCGTQWWHYNQ